MKSPKWSGISRNPWFHTLTVTFIQYLQLTEGELLQGCFYFAYCYNYRKNKVQMHDVRKPYSFKFIHFLN